MFDYIETAKKRCLQGSRAVVSDIDMMLELLKDVPKDGQVVKLGANCPIALVIMGERPDVHFLSIEDHDEVMTMEDASINKYHELHGLDKTRYTCWFDTFHENDGMVTGNAYKGHPIDLMFFHFAFQDESMTAKQMMDRITVWTKHLAKPAWVVIDNWEMDKRIHEACGIMGRLPDRQSGWEAAWRLS